jgi:hypothetical protein
MKLTMENRSTLEIIIKLYNYFLLHLGGSVVINLTGLFGYTFQKSLIL